MVLLSCPVARARPSKPLSSISSNIANATNLVPALSGAFQMVSLVASVIKRHVALCHCVVNGLVLVSAEANNHGATNHETLKRTPPTDEGAGQQRSQLPLRHTDPAAAAPAADTPVRVD